MTANARRISRVLTLPPFDDEAMDVDPTRRELMTDVMIFGAAAILAAVAFRTAAADNNVTFLILGVSAAFAAALPLWDRMSSIVHPIARRRPKSLLSLPHSRALPTPHPNRRAPLHLRPASRPESAHDNTRPAHFADGVRAAEVARGRIP